MLKRLFYLFLLASSIGLPGCKTASTGLNVLQPAVITLPDNVQKFALINRTYPDKDSKFWNIAEGILTGEGVGTDRAGSEETITGLHSVMSQSPRFELYRPAVRLTGTGTGQYPAPLDWAKVEQICKENNVDALITLEAFDSNSGVSFTNSMVKQKNNEGVMIDVPQFNANMRMNVTVGWRIYDPSTKRILDEHRFDDYMNFNGVGPTQDAAASRLPPKMECLNRTGRYAGTHYGQRISPLWTFVGRMYYVKGNDPLKTAGRKAKAKDWKGAAVIWQKEALNKSTKVAGRACYNMALACEVEGKLDLALIWAQKSYTEFNNKKGLGYVHMINQRIADNEKLNFQMRSKNVEGGQ